MERMEDRDIRREIDEKLHAIEEKEHVRILYAVESGSRAWGLASPDSDYDVRFLYVRPMEEYLRLDSPRDVIEWQLDEVLDINGWDLRKALVQFQKGTEGIKIFFIPHHFPLQILQIRISRRPIVMIDRPLH